MNGISLQLGNCCELKFVLILFLCCIVGCSKGERIVENHSDGKIKAEYYQVEESNHGSYTGYFTNGRISVSGNYKEGKRHGEFIYYDSTGVKRKIAHYINDLMNGTVYDYYPTGQLAGFLNYDMGVRNGESVTYYQNGNVRFKTSFENGERVFFDEYDSISNELTRWWMQVEISHSRDSLNNHEILFSLKNKKFDNVGVDFELISNQNDKEGLLKWKVDQQSSTSEVKVIFTQNELGNTVLLEGHILDLQNNPTRDGKFLVKNGFYFKRAIEIIGPDSSVVTDLIEETDSAIN